MKNAISPWGPTSLTPKNSALAVLVSGGLDSAILVGESLGQHAQVHPLYVRQGLLWESAELHYLKRFLEVLGCPVLKPLTVLEMPVVDLYGNHWSITGQNVPSSNTPDEAVFLPGRNILLLAKAILWCHLQGVPNVALAPLESNPFPDATVEFFAGFQNLLNTALVGRVQVLCPFRGLHKKEVMYRGRNLPLDLTFSCIHPVEGQHCGQCNKCAERRRAFAEVGWPDPTDYQREDEGRTKREPDSAFLLHPQQ
jgi:7-cyano-7-deazaguanine synthase